MPDPTYLNPFMWDPSVYDPTWFRERQPVVPRVEPRPVTYAPPNVFPQQTDDGWFNRWRVTQPRTGGYTPPSNTLPQRTDDGWFNRWRSMRPSVSPGTLGTAPNYLRQPGEDNIRPDDFIGNNNFRALAERTGLGNERLSSELSRHIMERAGTKGGMPSAPVIRSNMDALVTEFAKDRYGIDTQTLGSPEQEMYDAWSTRTTGYAPGRRFEREPNSGAAYGFSR